MSVVLILPGLNGSGLEHWQTRWQRKLPDARRVEEDDWDHPRCDAWVASLEQAVSRAGPDTVLAAHSLGCLQVAHWAAVTKRSVRAALLVAPPDPDSPSFPDVIQGFRPLPRAPLPFASLLVASHDDPYSSFAFCTRLAGDWGSTLVDAGCCGHINAASGLGDWPFGQECLRRLLASPP